MKLSDVLKSANGNIWHSPIRTILTIAAIFVGAYTLTLTTSMGAAISQFIDKQVGDIGGKNTLTIRVKDDRLSGLDRDEPRAYRSRKTDIANGTGFMRSVMDDKDLARIKALPGIIDVEPVKSVGISYIGNGDNKFVAQVRKYEEDTKSNLEIGRVPNNKAAGNEIEIPERFGKSLGFGSDESAIGKTVQIGVQNTGGDVTEVPATVIGVARKSVFGFQFATMNEALQDKLYDIQRAGLPDAIKDKYFILTAHFDPTANETAVEQIKTSLQADGYDASTIQDQIGLIKNFFNVITMSVGGFSLIALFAASFGVVNTLLMAVQERTKEIGLMKAMGMGSGRVFTLFSAEAILLGFWGSFVGCGLAILTGEGFNAFASRTFLKDSDNLQAFVFPVQNILMIMGAIMLVTFIAGALPSLRASRLDPITALRYE